MDIKYKIKKMRVGSLNFKEDFGISTNKSYELQVNIETTVMASNKPDIKDYLVRLNFNVNDKNGKYCFECSILSRVDIFEENDDKIKEVLEKQCVPDLVNRGRELIKNITTQMNIKPLDLPPFEEEE